MVSQMRSNDVVYGYKNDVAWANYLMDKMVQEVGNVEKGHIIWQVMNLHVYERHFDLVKA